MEHVVGMGPVPRRFDFRDHSLNIYAILPLGNLCSKQYYYYFYCYFPSLPFSGGSEGK